MRSKMKVVLQSVLVVMVIVYMSAFVFAADAAPNASAAVQAIAAQAAADNPPVSVAAGTVTTAESPSRFSSFVQSVKNSKLNEKLKVDGFLFAGKLYDVQKDEIGDYDRLNLTSKKGSILLQGEVGIRYGIVRPFVGFENLTHVYDKRTVGTDIFFYSTEKMGSFGIRTGYQTTKREGIDRQNFLFSGLLWKF